METNHTLLFKTIVGSQAYGTSVPGSDTDIKGIYAQSVGDLISFNYREQINTSKDETYYEVRRFLQLLESGNPTMLELLYSPEDMILTSSPGFELIQEHRDMFLTKKCVNAFSGYAIAQIKKARGLDKKMNWDKERVVRKNVLDFCYILDTTGTKSIPLKLWLEKTGTKQEEYGLSKIRNFPDCYAVFHESELKTGWFKGIVQDPDTSNTVSLSSIPKECKSEVIMTFNQNEYSIHCKEYQQYQTWLENRNESRYVDTLTHGQKIDGKNLMHCRRLLDMALEIAQGQGVIVRRPNAEELLRIRRGELDLEQIIHQAEQDIMTLGKLFEESDLPTDVDHNQVNNLLLTVRKLI